MSVNVEIPKEKSLQYLAPEKNHKNIYEPMKYINTAVLENREDKKSLLHVPRFIPAGQSTQMIVGASDDTDYDILTLSSSLYRAKSMRRVYYSGYVSVNTYDNRLPALKQPPLVRENRLYQADWLMRFYQFRADELVDVRNPNLDLDVDPKIGWALRHPECFPIDVNKAPYEMLLRVPGIGVKSANLIVNARRYRTLGSDHLKKIGVVLKRAQYFIVCRELPLAVIGDLSPEYVKLRLMLPSGPSRRTIDSYPSLF